MRRRGHQEPSTEKVNSRSYRVKVGGTVYRRIRRQLVCSGEEPRDETSRYDATSPPERDNMPLSLSDRCERMVNLPYGTATWCNPKGQG